MGGATATTRRRSKPDAGKGTRSAAEGWIETFAAGTYDGDQAGEVWEYSTADMDTIARNFAVLSAGTNPLHKVPVVETHDGKQALGWVADARRAGDRLDTRWADVVPELEKLIRSKRYDKVSAEVKRDFTDRTGKVTPGPYLYRVAVLGADVPRVKGLADLSQSFADPRNAVRPGRWITRAFKFADAPPRVSTMTREQAVQFLTQMGIDPAAMGPDVPDAFLIAVAQAWSDEEDLEPDGTNPTPTPKTAMSDPPVTGNPQPKKVSVVQTYADPKFLRKLIAREVATATAAATKTITDAANAEAQAREKRAAAERQAAVRLFCDQRAKEGKLSPAENDEGAPTSIRARLLRLAAQAPVTHKFADPKDAKKEVTRTELELQQEEIDQRPARKFSERVHQGGTQGGSAEPEYAQRVQQRCADAVKRAAERGTLRGPAPSLS